MLGAALLDSIYRVDNVNFTAISVGDIIIAATSVILTQAGLKAIILTANGRDFPRPFLKEVYTKRLYYRSNEILVYLLEPNLTIIENKNNNRR